MHNLAHFYGVAPVASAQLTRVLEEIAYLESCLLELGSGVDESSYARSYRTLIAERRRQLAATVAEMAG